MNIVCSKPQIIDLLQDLLEVVYRYASWATLDDLLYFAFTSEPTVVFLVFDQSKELVGCYKVVENNDFSGTDWKTIVVDDLSELLGKIADILGDSFDCSRDVIFVSN